MIAPGRFLPPRGIYLRQRGKLFYETRKAAAKLTAGDCFHGNAESRGLAQGIGAVGLFPGESGSGAAEVAVSSCLLVNRTAQIKRLDDRLRRERKILPHQFRDFFFWNRGGAERVPHYRDGLCRIDRKSTRLNSSHQIISYAVFCLKKKKT